MQVKECPKDQAVVDRIIDRLEEVGAMELCIKECNDMVQSAWDRLDALLPSSLPKVFLHLTGLYVVKKSFTTAFRC